MPQALLLCQAFWTRLPRSAIVFVVLHFISVYLSCFRSLQSQATELDDARLSKPFREKWGLNVNEIRSALMIEYDQGTRSGVERCVTLKKFVMLKSGPGVLLLEFGQPSKYILAHITGVRKAEFCIALIVFA